MYKINKEQAVKLINQISENFKYFCNCEYLEGYIDCLVTVGRKLGLQINRTERDIQIFSCADCEQFRRNGGCFEEMGVLDTLPKECFKYKEKEKRC